MNKKVYVSRLETAINLFSTNRILLIIFVVVSFLLMPSSDSRVILTLVLLLASILVCRFMWLIVDRLLLKWTIVNFESYLKKTRHLIQYLKDVEIVSMIIS